MATQSNARHTGKGRWKVAADRFNDQFGVRVAPKTLSQIKIPKGLR